MGKKTGGLYRTNKNGKTELVHQTKPRPEETPQKPKATPKDAAQEKKTGGDAP